MIPLPSSFGAGASSCFELDLRLQGGTVHRSSLFIPWEP